MVKPGIYKHYKGNVYEVLFTAKHSETLEPLVVYRDTTDSSKVWARPENMWSETVTIGGKTVLRFAPLSE